MTESKTPPITMTVASPSPGRTEGDPDVPLGVARMKSISQHLTPAYRIAIFVSIFLVGFSYGLASSLIAVYQSYATAGYQSHSLLATSNTLRAIFSVVAQPTAAKLTDVLGRLEIIYLCATLYLLGLILQAASNDVATFVAGAILHQMGLATTQVMVEVIVADLSSTRGRLFFYTVPNLHFIATIWVSGNISSSLLAASTWRWGIGMWAIVYVVCIVPFITCMVLAERRAHQHSGRKFETDSAAVLKSFLRQIDAPGLFLLAGALALILTPISLAGGVTAKWQSANIIAPIVFGFLFIPAFVLWELRAPQPIIPFSHIRNRSVWGALGVGLFFNFAVAMQRGYLYTVLVVAFDFDIVAATRISTVYSFMAFVIGPLTGLAVYYIRRLRPFMLSGVLIFTIAFGLLLRFRGGNGTSDKAGIIAGQVMLGFGGGLFGYAATVGMQASLRHEHVAVMIALYIAMQYIGNSLGSSVSGAIWNQLLPSTLTANLGDAALAMKVFANPFAIAAQNPVGTSIRTAIIESYKHVQQILCAIGLGLCIPVIGFAVVIPNPELTDAQSLVRDDSVNSPLPGAFEQNKSDNKSG
jgi:MFS transporter, SIT family, siderophore-iron:H+ symporter